MTKRKDHSSFLDYLYVPHQTAFVIGVRNNYSV